MRNSRSNYVLVITTTPDINTARKLSRAALKARLIACANILPKVESHYWWKEKIESSGEVLLFLKTSRRRMGALEKLIIGMHPYDTPEFLAVPLAYGNKKYLDWLGQALS